LPSLEVSNTLILRCSLRIN